MPEVMLMESEGPLMVRPVRVMSSLSWMAPEPLGMMALLPLLQVVGADQLAVVVSQSLLVAPVQVLSAACALRKKLIPKAGRVRKRRRMARKRLVRGVFINGFFS